MSYSGSFACALGVGESITMESSSAIGVDGAAFAFFRGGIMTKSQREAPGLVILMC